jgi:hypothetical protein
MALFTEVGPARSPSPVHVRVDIIFQLLVEGLTYTGGPLKRRKITEK